VGTLGEEGVKGKKEGLLTLKEKKGIGKGRKGEQGV